MMTGSREDETLSHKILLLKVILKLARIFGLAPLYDYLNMQ